MSTLALDLGTKTGWAWGDGAGTVMSGVWDFHTKRHENPGMRYLRFAQELEKLNATLRPKEVYFEEVRRHAGTSAAHVYGGFKSHLEAFCSLRDIPYASIPVPVIKRSWTGKGNANKEHMTAEAVRRGYEPTDDNEADALAILHCALKSGRAT